MPDDIFSESEDEDIYSPIWDSTGAVFRDQGERRWYGPNSNLD